MTANLSEELDDKSADDVFQAAVDLEESQIDAGEPLEEGADDEAVAFDHNPTDDDPEEYWEGFAASKGWNDDPKTVKPGYWTDYRAFVNKYSTIQDSKNSKAETSALEKKIDLLAKSQLEVAKRSSERHDREVKDLKNQLLQKQQDAKDEGDFEAYDEAKDQIKALDDSATVKTEEPETAAEPDVFVSFRNDNPEVMHDSDDFDPTLNSLLEAKVNTELKSGRLKTEDDLTKFMADTLPELKGQFVKYQGKQPATPPNTARSKAKAPATAKVDIASLTPDERDYYNHFMDSGMKDTAAEFLNNISRG